MAIRKNNKAYTEKSQSKFIVLYGINNLGKTTQAEKLVKRLQQHGHSAEYIKYALYALEPSGTFLNEYLRKGNPFRLSAREFQIIQALNKTQYQPQLIEKLESGTCIVAEDYVGTSLAWGIGTGVSEEFLTKLNNHLIKESIAILLDGKRFKHATENNHTHETDEALIERVRKIHLQLAKKYRWHIINANQTVEDVHKQIWEKVQTVL